MSYFSLRVSPPLRSWTLHNPAPGNKHHTEILAQEIHFIHVWNRVIFVFLPPCSANDPFSSPSFFCQSVSLLLLSVVIQFLSLSLPDKRGAVSDHQPGDGADRLASRGHQVSPQWAFPGRTGERQPAHVAARSVYTELGGDCWHEWFIEIVSFRTTADSSSPEFPVLCLSLLISTHLWFSFHLFLNIFNICRPGESQCIRYQYLGQALPLHLTLRPIYRTTASSADGVGRSL